jgi:hypothetical protein
MVVTSESKRIFEPGVGKVRVMMEGDPSGQTGYVSGIMSLQAVTAVGIGGYHKGMISPLR